MFSTYILYSATLESYYFGSTSNLVDRLKTHNSGRSTYTKRGLPWTVVYSSVFDTKSEAYHHELYIKSQKSKQYIERLIQEKV